MFKLEDQDKTLPRRSSRTKPTNAKRSYNVYFLIEVPRRTASLSAMAEGEPPPKKRKLTHQWLVDQLKDFEESVRQTVASHLADFSEDDLKKAPFDVLVQVLPEDVDEKTKKQVALRLGNAIREAFQQPPAPAP